jgi:hypothetical protein
VFFPAGEHGEDAANGKGAVFFSQVRMSSGVSRASGSALALARRSMMARGP